MKSMYNVVISPSSFAVEDKSPLHVLEGTGVRIINNPFGRRLTEEEIIVLLQDADGLIAGLEPLNRNVLSQAKKLKVIARVGIGVTNIDFDAAREFGIKVSTTPDGPTEAVAEMTIAALLTLCRQIIPSNSSLHSGGWVKRIGFSLKDTNVLIVGYGRIGKAVGQLLHAFGAKLLVVDPYMDSSTLTLGEKLVTLSEGLAEAKVISLHANGTDVIIGSEEFDIMTKGVVLLNSARGELVDEAALIDALESGKVSAAWFDAFWSEPYVGRLTEFEQVILTPHVCTYTVQCRRSMEMEAVRNLLRDLEVNT